MKKKFHISKLDCNMLESALKYCGGGRFAAEITLDGDRWSVEVVDWFEFYAPSATPYNAYIEWDKGYSVVINKTLTFYEVDALRRFIWRHYGKERAESVDSLFRQVPHQVRVGDYRSMVFVELEDDIICRLEAIWTGEVLDREHVSQVRLIFERGTE